MIRNRNFTGYSIYTIVDLADIERIAKLNNGIPSNASIDEIWADICDCFGITIEEGIGASRKNKFVIPRQIFWHVLKELHPEASLNEIAKFTGHRDHTSVVHGRKAVKNYLKVGDPKFLKHWYRFLEKTKIYRNGNG